VSIYVSEFRILCAYHFFFMWALHQPSLILSKKNPSSDH